MQGVEASLIVWSASSIASSCVRERRLELGDGAGVLWALVLSPFCCRIEQEKGVRRCTGGRRKEYEGEGEAAFTDGVGIGRRCLQTCGTLASNFAAAGRWFRGEAKGDERGVPGLFIADSNLRRGLGFLAGGGDPAARREAVRERETSAKGGR
jgi:hypothetical protein